MLTIKRLTTSPLDLNERTTAARFKIMKKLKDDYEELIRVTKGRKVDAFKVHKIVKNIELNYVEIYIKIPSEPFPFLLTYDVVLRFYAGITNRITPETPIQVFSNSPSFMFTFAYVFARNDAIIDEMSHLLGARALNEAPSKTNPKQLIGFEKSLYFALMHLNNTGLKDLDDYLSRNSNIVNVTGSRIPSSDEKLKEYNFVKNKNKDLYNKYVNRNKVGFF